MANVTPTVVKVTDGGVQDVYITTWTPLGNADTGLPVAMSSAPDRSVQITGTFGSATITVEGSNDGVNYVVLTDPQGNAISKTTAAIEAISELTRYIRCASAGGTGTAVTVSLLTKGQY